MRGAARVFLEWGQPLFSWQWLFWHALPGGLYFDYPAMFTIMNAVSTTAFSALFLVEEVLCGNSMSGFH